MLLLGNDPRLCVRRRTTSCRVGRRLTTPLRMRALNRLPASQPHTGVIPEAMVTLERLDGAGCPVTQMALRLSGWS